jgi:transcriptional regulator with XRE-family HTH domain
MPTPLDELLAGQSPYALEKSGVISRQTISRWKRGIGKKPQYSVVLRLSRALGCGFVEALDAVVRTLVEARRKSAAPPPGEGPQP